MSRSRPWKLVSAAAAVAVVIGALAGCSAGGGARVPTTDAKVLTIASQSAPISLDPLAINNGPGVVYQELAYEPLIEVDGAGKLTPGLATEWGYVDGSGSTQFALTLRDGVEFADGTPLDADAVAASLNWFAANATGPTAGSFAGWKAEANGKDKVTITSPSPNPVMANLLTPNYLGGNIVSAAGIADAKKLANETFGAGPYVYDASQSATGDHYTYVPNPNYYDKSRIAFDKVVIRVIANATSALSALKSGQIDVMAGDTTVADSATQAGFSAEGAANSISWLAITDWKGELVPALGDVRVRQAMNYAIDRKTITSAVYGERGEPTDQPNTPAWDAFDASLDGYYPYDPEKAKDLLAQAGYAGGFSFKVTYASYDPNTSKVVQALAEQLGKVGITLELNGSGSIGELVSDISAGKTPAFSLAWGGQTQFAQVNQLWLPNSPVNFLKNEPVDGLQAAFTAYVTSSEDQRDAAARAVQKVLVEQAVSVPVSRVESVYLYNPQVKGFAIRPDGNLSNPAEWSK